MLGFSPPSCSRFTLVTRFESVLPYFQFTNLLRVARADNLAQASLPRLGEMSRDSPRPFHASGRLGDQLSFERASISLRRGESHLSENAQRPLFLCVELSPRRMELA
ncbi:hypothetical protein DEO72_LG1g2277 [Vigna unguiculata]|uniref:Uncharacterized protein n=1 Tax=Vigna unguiculata TaxID=3917 RepID=A0A4D6KVZ0_VIGUN|nr:hypothetical protein DEO72_LG1g2277 [Vigna unguiculata]